MLKIAFYDREAMNKKYTDMVGDCVCVVSGTESEVKNLCDCIPEFWYGVKKSRKYEAYILLKDFSHFLDIVVCVQNYFNGLTEPCPCIEV